MYTEQQLLDFAYWYGCEMIENPTMRKDGRQDYREHMLPHYKRFAKQFPNGLAHVKDNPVYHQFKEWAIAKFELENIVRDNLQNLEIRTKKMFISFNVRPTGITDVYIQNNKDGATHFTVQSFDNFTYAWDTYTYKHRISEVLNS